MTHTKIYCKALKLDKSKRSSTSLVQLAMFLVPKQTNPLRWIDCKNLKRQIDINTKRWEMSMNLRIKDPNRKPKRPIRRSSSKDLGWTFMVCLTLKRHTKSTLKQDCQPKLWGNLKRKQKSTWQAKVSNLKHNKSRWTNLESKTCLVLFFGRIKRKARFRFAKMRYYNLLMVKGLKSNKGRCMKT